MNLRVEKVKLTDKNVKKIYVNSFPKKERMPFILMVLQTKMTSTDFLAFYDGDLLCGFVYMANVRNITFIMFFAVDKNICSKGYGSEILKHVQLMHPNNKIVITIEKCDKDVPDIENRIRRKNFYLKNGYTDTGYMIELSKTEQEIMIKNGIFRKEEFIDFFKKYSNNTMRPKIWRK